MKDVNEFIANLSPDKRAEFVQKLRSGKKQAKSDVAKPKEQQQSSPINADENFYFSMETPGHFKSFVRKQKEILPPSDEHVQVRVKAASLNFRDLMIAMNIYHATPGVVSVMGSDFSGVVTQVGANVTEFKPGDEVICLSAGSLLHNGELDENSHFAAITNIKPNQITCKPAHISWQEAACIPTAFLTSYFALTHTARLEKGQKILIHTASGGVGLSAIQIARWLGAEIYVTAGTDAKRLYLKSIGFDHPMNSRTTDFADEIMKLTNGEGVDVVLNTLAGEAAREGLKILKNFGHFLQIDKKDIAANKSIELGEFKKGLSYSAIDLGLFYLHPQLMKKQLDEISAHYENGDFQPIKYETFNITELESALTYMSKSQHIGKIVLEYT